VRLLAALLCLSLTSLATSSAVAAPTRRSSRAALTRLVADAPPPPAIVAPPAEPVATVLITKKPRWGLVGGGITLFLAGYAANLGMSYGLSNPDASHAIIPLIGPLVQMGDKWGITSAPAASGNAQVDKEINTRTAQVNDTIQTVAYVVLSLDFALQLAGAILAVVGGTTKHTVVHVESGVPPVGRSSVKWQLMPGPNGGSTVALRF
jgi:hypothetical protein